MKVRIGTKRIREGWPGGFTVADIQNELKKHGFRCKVLACGLADFSRFAMERGFVREETSLSLAGRRYMQTATLEIRGHLGREEEFRELMRQMQVDILDPLGNPADESKDQRLDAPQDGSEE